MTKDFQYPIFKEFDDVWPILTAGDRQHGFNAMTISWGGLGTLWNKPVAFIFVRKQRYTYSFMEKCDSVTLSFLSNDYKEAKALFGSKSGRNIDKFKETGLHATLDLDFNGYYVAEAEYVLKLKKLYSLDLKEEGMPENIVNNQYPQKDFHRMYVCEVVQYLENEE